MLEKDKNSDKSPKKEYESVSAAPAPGPEEYSTNSERHQLEGNDPAAVIEAAKRAEMAVSDAVKGVAQTIVDMKPRETGD